MLKKTHAALVIACLFFSVPVFGGGIFPGANGVPSRSNDPRPDYMLGTMGNPSQAEWLCVTLPVGRESYIANWIDGWVKVVDNSVTNDFYAFLCSVVKPAEGMGYYVYRSALSYSSGSGDTPQILEFRAIGGEALAHTYIHCAIPPNDYSGPGAESRIISYSVNEQ